MIDKREHGLTTAGVALVMLAALSAAAITACGSAETEAPESEAAAGA